MEKVVFEFDCPCGTPSYIAMVVSDDGPALDRAWRMAHWAMEEHVDKEGNVYDPSRLIIRRREAYENRI